MNAYRPVTGASDRRAEMPADAAARLDHIDRAIASLENESRRVERLGLENPQVRCEQERRYWAFLAAVHSVTQRDTPILSRQLASWLHGSFEPITSLADEARAS